MLPVTVVGALVVPLSPSPSTATGNSSLALSNRYLTAWTNVTVIRPTVEMHDRLQLNCIYKFIVYSCKLYFMVKIIYMLSLGHWTIIGWQHKSDLQFQDLRGVWTLAKPNILSTKITPTIPTSFKSIGLEYLLRIFKVSPLPQSILRSKTIADTMTHIRKVSAIPPT